MDGMAEALQEKLNQLLQEAARVAVALNRVNRTVVGVPHYSVIEARAPTNWGGSSAARYRPVTWARWPLTRRDRPNVRGAAPGARSTPGNAA